MNQAIYPFHHGEENKLTLFLEKRPAVTQVGIRDNLERGTFLLKLTYCQPGDFSHHSGKKVPFEVKKGDRVLVSKYGGTEIKLDGKEFKILNSEDVLAVLD